MMTPGTWTQMLSGCERLSFDSNALIYFLEGYPRYSDRVAEALSLLEQDRAVGFVSTMVEMELQVLPMRDNDKRRTHDHRKVLPAAAQPLHRAAG